MELEKIVKYYGNGIIDSEYSINIETGLKEGEYKVYYSNGNLSSECFYKDGKMEGAYKLYYPNGNLSYECFYINDIIEGEYRSYYDNGELNFIEYYYNGEEVSKDIYDIIKSEIKTKENAFDKAIKHVNKSYCDDHLNIPYMLIGDVIELIKILTGKEVDIDVLTKKS